MIGERILVVDDEKGVVRSCVRILERRGYTVFGTSNSASVPELLKQESFDLLLSDIKMPRLDGLELLRIAKDIDPYLSVVLITGFGTMEHSIRAIRLGAQGFLMKPFEPDELIATVEDNLSRRALIRDSLRLQTLLPLLEINQTLQVSGGEISLVQRILEIAQRELGAARIAWFTYNPPSLNDAGQGMLITAAIVPSEQTPSRIPQQAIDRVLQSKQPIWMLSDGGLTDNNAEHPNIVGTALPLMIKGKLAGILTAETGDGATGPFGQISLDLLPVLVGQLAIIIENVSLFQQTEALRAFNEDIIHNMTNGLIAIDSDCKITAFNPAASRMLGYSIAAVLQQPVSLVMAEAEALVDALRYTLDTRSPQTHLEITVQRKTGQPLPISLSTAPLEGSSEGGGVVAVFEDLSELKALEAERRQLDRLAALGEMAAVVAHEIRNPVAGIAAGVDYLARNAPPDSLEAEGATMIQDEIKRISRILEDILFVARPLQLDLSLHALPQIIERVIKRCHPQLTAGNITVSTKFNDDLPQLKVDSQRLEQVFTNLILNATQAMHQGGQLNLQSQVEPANGMGQALVVITITDTGPGIETDTQQRIFEPFFTTKSKGTGLGLSVARRIIEGHKGTITVESKNGKGTSFTIKLPTSTQRVTS